MGKELKSMVNDMDLVHVAFFRVEGLKAILRCYRCRAGPRAGILCGDSPGSIEGLCRIWMGFVWVQHLASIFEQVNAG